MSLSLWWQTELFSFWCRHRSPACCKKPGSDGRDPCRGPIILACAILYAIPATAVLGAILVTGFLGGAICAHVRIGELGSPPEIISLLLGAMTWGGLYARDPRIRAILPLIR